MSFPEFEYPETRRVTYAGGAQFIPVCERCGRYVKARKTIKINGEGLHPGPNADCSKCGPTRMLFDRRGEIVFPEFEYPETRRVTYAGGAQFIPVCERCGRYVKAPKTIKINGDGLHPGPNANCSKCGSTRMIFEGFIGEEES